MSKQVYRINKYRFSSTDALLFDANIWLFIYGPQNNLSPRFRAIYSSALGRICSAKGQIFIDVLVLSEFINTYARFAYNKLPLATKPSDYKTFRNSTAFKPVGQRIARESRKILVKCQRIESSFESVNLESLLSDYAAGCADFNDQILAELCRKNNLKLVTHDADFSDSDLTILTANTKLLK